MFEIRLPLQEIKECCDKENLQKIENELTQEDYEWYDTHGWKNYRPENHIDYLLPSLDEPLYIRNSTPVVLVKGKKYKVVIENDYNSLPYEAKGKTLVLSETDEPLSKTDATKANCYYQFFGQPRWIQTKQYPAHNGKPCYHFVTVENGWGDMGNWNILVALGENDIPVAAYFEASCS